MKNIIWPNDKEITRELVGNKAWNLTQLFKYGFKVPKFFVITAQVFALDSFYLEEEILKNFDKLKSPHAAVRSSATCEDSQNSSFAGQFESYLAIPKEKIIETVKKCWASTKSPRVLSYATHHNINPSSIKMAVTIQEMIFAKKGGVIFTQDIFKNDLNHLIIEAASGLGEKIVSGLINPERVVVNKKTGLVIEKDSPEGEVLTQREIGELVRMALKIEKNYHSPQDIEWAIGGGKIYILQSRPITN